MKKVKCQICNLELKNFRALSNHIKIHHNINSQNYYDTYIGKTYCKECGCETNFKNINIGYKDFCSVRCLNVHKSKDPIFLKKISDSQKGIPRKKHSEETKKLLSEISKKMWNNVDNRERILSIMRSDENREKISKSVSLKYYSKNVSFINNIRCESKAEEKFVNRCINENIKLKRFEIDGEKTIKIKNNWRLPDFIIFDNIIVDVKDFHIWFKKELFSGLKKYLDIKDWCDANNYIFKFWFVKYGYISIEDLLNIKNQEDLDYFIKNYKQ